MPERAEGLHEQKQGPKETNTAFQWQADTAEVPASWHQEGVGTAREHNGSCDRGGTNTRQYCCFSHMGRKQEAVSRASCKADGAAGEGSPESRSSLPPGTSLHSCLRSPGLLVSCREDPARISHQPLFQPLGSYITALPPAGPPLMLGLPQPCPHAGAGNAVGWWTGSLRARRRRTGQGCSVRLYRQDLTAGRDSASDPTLPA